MQVLGPLVFGVMTVVNLTLLVAVMGALFRRTGAQRR